MGLSVENPSGTGLRVLGWGRAGDCSRLPSFLQAQAPFQAIYQVEQRLLFALGCGLSHWPGCQVSAQLPSLTAVPWVFSSTCLHLASL